MSCIVVGTCDSLAFFHHASDLFTHPGTRRPPPAAAPARRRGHRLPGDLFTPAVPPDPLERAPLPALSAQSVAVG
jgi:hypothetical protein